MIRSLFFSSGQNQHIWVAVFFLIILSTAFMFLPPVGASNMSNASAMDSYYITIDPIGNHSIGEVFFINGTTNLPTCENLSMEIADIRTYSPPHIKSWVFTAIPGKYVSILFIPIVADASRANRWSVNVSDTVKELNASRYSVVVWSEKNASYNNSGCPDIKEATMEFLTLYPINSTFFLTSSTTQTPIQQFLTVTQSPLENVSLQTTTRSSPISVVLPVITIAVIIVLNIIRNKKRD